MAKFLHAILANPAVKFFRVHRFDADNPREWDLEPLATQILSDRESDGLHVMKAVNVLPKGAIRECYIDINLPERIIDYVYFPRKRSLRFGYLHEFPGEILPAVALDCFGVYDIFYSRKCPEIGIQVLRSGLKIAKRKRHIAEDLAYIFRDERRFREAAEMFKLAIKGKPSSYFIYSELAGAYAELGDTENQRKYAKMFQWAVKGESALSDSLRQELCDLATRLLDSR
jgi:hypothetical protein